MEFSIFLFILLASILYLLQCLYCNSFAFIFQFCHKLPLTQGTWVRRLRVSPYDSRPDYVYVVGVDVRPGRGRYRDTYMVTFSPRFQIENRSSHELIIAQKCFSTSFVSFFSFLFLITLTLIM